MRLTFLALFMLVASVGFFACSNDDDSGTEAIQAESTPSAPPGRGYPPTATPSPTLADDNSALEPLAPLVAEAAELCPSDVVAQCTGAYVAAALGALPGALCVSEGAGTWFMETPGEGVAVGDACAMDATHTVVALLNY